MKLEKILSNNKGVAMIFTIMIILVAMSACIALSLLATGTYTSAMRDASQQQAFYYAKSIGQALSLQMGSERAGEGSYDVGEIIKELDKATEKVNEKSNGTLKDVFDTSGELSGSFSITDADSGNGVVTGDLRFYYPVSQTNVDGKATYKVENKFLYVDISVEYNGASSTITAVFTCLDDSEFTENMYDLFSNYHVYSTHPQNQKFKFANASYVPNTTQPSVYLYVGEDIAEPQTYILENDVNAEITTTGTVSVDSNAGIRTVGGNVTSYGDLTLSKVSISKNLYNQGFTTINSSAYVAGNIFSRGSIKVNGNSGTESTIKTQSLYSIGDVTLNNCFKKVNNVVGGDNCDVTIDNSHVSGNIYTKGDVTIKNNSVVYGEIYCGGNLSIENSEVYSKAITVKGDMTAVAKSSSSCTIGTTGSKIYVKGKLGFNSASNEAIKVTGTVEVGDDMMDRYNTGNKTKIVGNLSFTNTVGNPHLGTSDRSVNVVDLVVTGQVQSETIITFETKDGKKNTTDFQGDTFIARSEQLTSGYVDMHGASIKNLVVGNSTGNNISDIFLQNGTITGTVIARNINLNNVKFGKNTKLNAKKSKDKKGGLVNIIADSRTPVEFMGTIYAEGDLIFTNVHYYARKDGVDYASMIRVLGNADVNENSIIAGEMFVGREGMTHFNGEEVGNLTIDGTVQLKQPITDSSRDRTVVYVYGNLTANVATKATVRDSAFIFYVTGSVNASAPLGTIYLVGDYDPNKVKEQKPTNSYYQKPFATYISNYETIIINDNWIKENKNNSNTYSVESSVNPNCIVYINTNQSVKIIGNINCGTFVLPQSVTNVSLSAVYCNKIVTPTTPCAESSLKTVVSQAKATDPVVINANFTAVKDSNVTYGLHVGDDLAYTDFTVNSQIHGLLKVEKATKVTINGSITKSKIQDTTTSDNGVIVSNVADVIAPNAQVVIGSSSKNGLVERNVKCKDLKLVYGSISESVEATGKITSENNGKYKALGTNYSVSSITLECNTFDLYGCTIGSNLSKVTTASQDDKVVLVSTGDSQMTGCTSYGGVKAKFLTIDSSYVYGNVYTTYDEIPVENATPSLVVRNNTYLFKNINAKGILSCTNSVLGYSSSAYNVSAGELRMDKDSNIGELANITITGRGHSVIYCGNITNLLAKGTAILIYVDIYQSKRTGASTAWIKGKAEVYGELTFFGVKPSADKGLYISFKESNLYKTENKQNCSCGGITDCTVCCARTINGDVYVKSPTSSVLCFSDINGNLQVGDGTAHSYFSGVKVRTGYVSGTILSLNTTIYLSKSKTINKSIKVTGFLRILTGTSVTVTVDSTVYCNSLLVNCTKNSDFNSTSSVTKYGSSTTKNLVTFKKTPGVKAGNNLQGTAFLFNTKFQGCTFYADGAMYAKYCYFTSNKLEYKAIADSWNNTNNLGDCYVDYGNGSFSVATSYSGSRTYVYNSIIRSHINVGGDATIQSCDLRMGFKVTSSNGWGTATYYFHTDNINGDWKNNGSSGKIKIYDGGDQEKNGMAKDAANYLSKCFKQVRIGGSKSMSDNSLDTDFDSFASEMYFKASEDGTNQKGDKTHRVRFVSSNPCSGSGASAPSTTAVTAPNLTVKSYTINKSINLTDYNLDLPFEDISIPTCGLTLISKINKLDLKFTPINENKSNFANHYISGTSHYADYYVLTTEAWNERAVPLDWNLPTQTADGTSTNLRTLSYATKELKVTVDTGWDYGFPFINIDLTNSMRKYVNLKDSSNFMPTSLNVNNLIGDRKGRDMIYCHRNAIDFSPFLTTPQPEFKWYDAVSLGTSYVAKWLDWTYKCVSNMLRDSSVGMIFFESGIVPIELFTSRSSSWGSHGTTLVGEGLQNLLSGGSVTDCNFTFFTCADPANPYTSAAKDLHIVFPANITMNWGKDVYNCVNIIGKGRVFLYLQDNTTITMAGAGALNWLKGDTQNIFGGVRYAMTDEEGRFDHLASAYEIGTGSTRLKLSPRMFIVGTGSNINMTITDYQTMAYVYMPNGYSRNKKDNTFTVKASDTFFTDAAKWISDGLFSLVGSYDNTGAARQWDIYGMYVTDVFGFGNDASAKVNYQKVIPDLTSTVIEGKRYNLSEFWGIPSDVPRAGLDWSYRGVVSY